ncbi:MAG TPA: S8 family serine peptidase [Pyrinomonadaceae bacterium]
MTTQSAKAKKSAAKKRSASKKSAAKKSAAKSAATAAATAKPKTRTAEAPTHARASSEKARAQSPAKSAAKSAGIVSFSAHTHPSPRQQFAPGMLVVKCKEDTVTGVPDIRTARVATVKALALPKAVDDPFSFLEQQGLIREVVPVFSRSMRGRALSVAPKSVAASFAMSVRDSENEDLRGINMLRLERGADLKKIEKDLSETPGIEYVHRVPRRWATARPLPRDPMAAQQWGLRSIRWFDPDPLPDASGVKVAVLDTGVDMSHPDLKNIVQTYVHDGASADDIIGHGTHVAGIISAQMNNRVGITGVCQCDLSVWKIFDDEPDPDDGEYYVDDVMYQRALNAARNSGMRVVNLSIGGTFRNPTEEFLFRRLVDAGVTVVAAMGNEFQTGNPVEFPGAFPGVIAVGAVGRTSRRASFSNTGRHIAIVAPGVEILSTLPLKPSAARDAGETKFAFWDGTSMATPHVAAAAALVLARFPNLTPRRVLERLTSTAIKVSAMGGKKFTNEYGHGLLDVRSAVS